MVAMRERKSERELGEKAGLEGDSQLDTRGCSHCVWSTYRKSRLSMHGSRVGSGSEVIHELQIVLVGHVCQSLQHGLGWTCHHTWTMSGQPFMCQSLSVSGTEGWEWQHTDTVNQQVTCDVCQYQSGSQDESLIHVSCPTVSELAAQTHEPGITLRSDMLVPLT